MLRRHVVPMPRATPPFFEILACDPDGLAGSFRGGFGWHAVEVPWNGPRYLRPLPPESAEPSGGGIFARSESAGTSAEGQGADRAAVSKR